MSQGRVDYRFALIGHGISKSMSPRLHAAIAASLGLRVDYELIDVTAGDVEGVLEQLRRGEWDGFNVTAPHKVYVADRLDMLRPLAAEVGAVNTVGCVNGQLWGANTDGFGFQSLIEELYPKRAMVLGAGGVARVVLNILKEKLSAPITIANRTRDRAYSIAGRGASTRVIGLDEAPECMSEFDLVVNCLPDSARTQWTRTFFQDLHRDAWVIDLTYGDSARRFHHHVLQGHGRFRDGRDMLIAQGIRAFELWTGRRPDIDLVRSRLLAERSE